jgi:Protein of unknown function (DUF2723)
VKGIVTELRHRLDLYLILSAVIPFTVFMLTLAPSVTFFDSGEFITATASLGSAHSPGYPLFLMFAKPFTWLPFGNIAFRVNMATAFSSSLACLGVYFLTVRLLKGERVVKNEAFSLFAIKTAALAAACCFAFTPRVWLQSNHDKPYPLLAFISAVILYMLFLWRDHSKNGDERPAFIYACSFLASMAMAVHQTVVLLVPAWLVFMLITDWRVVKRVRELILATFFALFGFAVHLYLPFRATQKPLLNWGDPSNSYNFLWHFLRKGYGDEPHPRDFALLWEQIKAFSVPHEFTWVGAALLLFALVSLWRKQREVVAAYLTAVFMFLIVIAGYFNATPDFIFLTEEFFTPLYLISAVLIGVGLHNLLAFAVRKSNLPEHYDAKVYSVVFVMFVSLPVCLGAANYYENDQHDNYISFDYATNSLRSLPQDAVMFTWGDSGAFPLWYLQGVERMREDVDLPHTPHLAFDWYLDSMPRLFSVSRLREQGVQASGAEVALRVSINEILGLRPVYIDFSTRYSVSFNSFQPVQNGIVYRIRRNSEPAGISDISIWENYNTRGVFEKISFLDLDTDKAIMIYAHSYLEAGELLMSAGYSFEAMKMFDKAENVSDSMKSSVQQILQQYGKER